VGVLTETGSGETEGAGAGAIDSPADAIVGCATVTPLLQTSFFPDLMQVNFLVPTIFVKPILEHDVPAFTIAKVGKDELTDTKVAISAIGINFFTKDRLIAPIGFVCKFH
jgi:hypothetical protein